MNFAATISREEIKALPLTSFDKKIYVIDNEEQVKKACDYLKVHPILGFDTETRPSFQKGVVHNVALLQLSSHEKAFLFRLNKIRLSANIKKILSDATIIKVGVAIRDDLITLKKKGKFEEHSFIELQEMVKKYGIQNFSLQKLAGITLGIHISKSKRLSNWETEILSEAQQKYAATDAWVSREIYLKLINST